MRMRMLCFAVALVTAGPALADKTDTPHKHHGSSEYDNFVQRFGTPCSEGATITDTCPMVFDTHRYAKCVGGVKWNGWEYEFKPGHPKPEIIREVRWITYNSPTNLWEERLALWLQHRCVVLDSWRLFVKGMGKRVEQRQW